MGITLVISFSMIGATLIAISAGNSMKIISTVPTDKNTCIRIHFLDLTAESRRPCPPFHDLLSLFERLFADDRFMHSFSCLDCHSDSDMKALEQKIEKKQNTQKRLKDQLVSLNEQKETSTLNFLETKEKISSEDVDAVLEEREKLRPEKMQEVRERLEETFQSAFRNDTLLRVEKISNSELQETESLHSVLQRLHQKEVAFCRQARTPKHHKDKER